MTDEHAAVLETTTGPDTLAELQQTLDRVWSERGIPDSVQMSMDLAVGEVGANIIEHASAGASVPLRMEVDVSTAEVRATLYDGGTPARLDLKKLSLPDELAESGRGLAIALAVLDELSYRRDETGNRWTLMTRLP
ncbi:ATP-binding protein [Mycobacterium sp. IDR2000157661]|uniref:ATP-binding protein n=1 Tax=Mycobacterium sp. IDR2000157661 TaxID=2867005 RepID=UPI001EEB3461|nr:ATP-binding protein [Mycobacterium sp. IDR2000157661]ULE34390.1 ATP-binding protein [Mycobacterium sp. IDR2000157661]